MRGGKHSTRSLERRLGDRARAALPYWAVDGVMFWLKQGWACLFGVLFAAGLVVSAWVWREDWSVARYDALFLYALLLQAAMLVFRLETWDEARVILIFHLTGTVMEWFKVSAGSWAYPGPGIMKVFDVPLFSGFMYAAVGSYIARVTRIFDMRFCPMSAQWITGGFAVAVYINFFSHHYLPDMRYGLFLLSVLIYGRTLIWFRLSRWYAMPLPLAAFLASLFLWIAENIGTRTKTWLYAGQTTGDYVSAAKIGSWYLLLYVSFATVALTLRLNTIPPAERSVRC